MTAKYTNKNLYKGIYLKIIHSMVFTIMSLLLLRHSETIPIVQVLFCRVLTGTIFAFLGLKLIKQPIPLTMSRKSVILYGARAVISFIAMSGLVVGLKNIGVNETIALGYITPIWLMISAVMFFKETLTIRHVVVVFVNIAAVMLILHPKFDTIDISSVLSALSSGLLWTIYNSVCKKQSETEHYILQCFYTFAFSTVITLPIAIYFWEPIMIEEFLELSLIGLIGVVNVSVLFLAYAYTPLIVLIPFDYLRLLFSMIISSILYNTSLTYRFAIGAAIIISADFYFYLMQRSIKKTIIRSKDDPNL